MRQRNDYYYISTINSTKYRRRKRRLNIYKISIIPILLLLTVISVSALKLLGKSNENELKNESASNVPSSQLTQMSPTSESSYKEENEKEVPDIISNIENNYNYSEPVPINDMVDSDYFDDAVFIGDSRTEGLLLNTGLTNAIEYTHKGLMVDTVFTQPVINMKGNKISVMDALRQTKFDKVYIMFGINETGWPYNDIFIEKYGKVIDEIKRINPDAIIYIQEILPVTQKVSNTHSYVKNRKIGEYNELIRKMAEEKQIYYIDVGSVVADNNGCLPEEATTDGIHLNKSYCEKWLEYLKTHTVTR